MPYKTLANLLKPHVQLHPMFNPLIGIFGKSRYVLTRLNTYEKYKCGQVWSYNTRENERQSKMTIFRIDKDRKDVPIFHVSLDRLALKNPHHRDGVIKDLPHTPLSITGMNCSTLKMIKTSADYSEQNEGYAAWLSAWRRGEANIYSVPVSDIIDFVERSLCAGNDSENQAM